MFTGKDGSESKRRHVVGYIVFFALAVGIAYLMAVIIGSNVLNFVTAEVEYYQYSNWINQNTIIYLVVGSLEGVMALLCLVNCSNLHPKAGKRRNRGIWIITFTAINIVISLIAAFLSTIINTWIEDSLIIPQMLFLLIEALVICLLLFTLLVWARNFFDW